MYALRTVDTKGQQVFLAQDGSFNPDLRRAERFLREAAERKAADLERLHPGQKFILWKL